VGTEAPVTVWRNGKEEQVRVTVAELPADQTAAAAPATPERTPPGAAVELAGLGLKVAAISPDLKQRFSLRDDARGVVVTDVTAGSSAAERGLTPGDLIIEVQQTRVSNPQEVREQLDRLRKQNRASALLLVENGQGQRFVPLRLRAEGGSSN
jgi:serine protease Do